MDPIALGIFTSRIEAVCDEMGAVLQRTAFSPNIKDRLDFSCAVFDAQGQLCAQAAHIPVHLGSMAYAMADIVAEAAWQPGDMVVVNDPFLGGTHLPDVTVIAPVFLEGALVAFVANRAHHANIGATSPGSMPISRTLEEEGVVISPTLIVCKGDIDNTVLAKLANGRSDVAATADFRAQISANRVGVERLVALVEQSGVGVFEQSVIALNDYAERLAKAELAAIPAGQYAFSDVMDSDGIALQDIPIKVVIDVSDAGITVDFTGTAAQVAGNINCPLSVAAAAVYYVFRCLMSAQMPACAGAFRAISLKAPLGSLVNAERPAAVAAGNVETSTRIVDVILGALAQALPERIPAASHGSMNNVAMGSWAVGDTPAWDYYETIGGGMGAGPKTDGLNGVQTHMTNTLNTPIESLEMHYPLRVVEYSYRQESGGAGKHQGGSGLSRSFEFLAPAQVTLLTERRRHAPWGLAGGADAQPGYNSLNGNVLPDKVSVQVSAGDVLQIATPGGGGWGEP